MEIIKNIFKEIPLIGGLVDCDFKDLWLAFQEVFINFTFSTVPIWIIAIFVSVTSDLGFLQAVEKNVSNGELFLYTAAIIGPIFYMALYDPPGAKKFPNKLSHIFCIAIVILITAFFFGVQRSDQSLKGLDIYHISVFLFIFSWSLQYLATAYKNQRLPKISSELFKRQEKGFGEGYKGHRRKQ